MSNVPYKDLPYLENLSWDFNEKIQHFYVNF
jgi:hypothetical protein